MRRSIQEDKKRHLSEAFLQTIKVPPRAGVLSVWCNFARESHFSQRPLVAFLHDVLPRENKIDLLGLHLLLELLSLLLFGPRVRVDESEWLTFSKVEIESLYRL